MELRFWGVRGSIASPQDDTVGYGGNTACVELRGPGDEVVVIDGGTGARKLGAALAAEFRGRPLVVHYLLTHFHSDHIQGLPFFEPLYDASTEVVFYSGSPPDYTRGVLEGQMADPYFPVPFHQVAARTAFVQLHEGAASIGAVSVRAFPLHHPQGASGFRVEDGSTVIVHASDLEHGDPRLDAVLREYARDSDVLIYDAQFTPDEYQRRRGWGHSTWVEATRVARDAGVQRLVLFHHDPSRTDAALDALVDQARQMFDHTTAAREWRRADKVTEMEPGRVQGRAIPLRDPGPVPEGNADCSAPGERRDDVAAGLSTSD